MIRNIVCNYPRIISLMLVLILAFSCVPVDGYAEATNNDPFIMVSLGDSYSSGEGIEPFYEQDKSIEEKVKEADWLAHRSELSWPGQLKVPGIPGIMKDYKVGNCEVSTAPYQWYFMAVSGAESKHIKNESQGKDYYYYKGLTLKSGHQDFAPQLSIFEGIGKKIDYVTMTVGGNDVDFTGVVTTTVLDSKYIGHAGTYFKLESLLKDLDGYVQNIQGTYKDVADAAPNAEIIVAGYPRLFSGWGCGAAISIAEAYMVNAAVSKFNKALENAVKELQQEGKKIHFADVEEAFKGHGAGGSNAWINSIMPRQSQDLDGRITNLFSAYSVHPNEDGAIAYAECVNEEIKRIEREKMESRIGNLAGKICKASDRTTPIADAQIQAYAPIRTGKTTPDNGGNYSMKLPASRYYVTVKADGYIPFEAYAVVKENQTEYMQTFLMVEGEESDIGTAQGMITNALSGIGISDVTLDVRKGWNNADEGEILTTVTTDDYGAYLVTLPIGNYTLCASREGFTSTMVNIIVQKTNSGNQNGTMTPILFGDDYRIVLTWGENPRDLDSHIVGTLTSGNSFHVYYGQKSQYDGQTEVCNLDVDDTTSYGPETITLHTTTGKPYYYYIHRYAGTGTVASSCAQVNVYQGQRQIATFNVPTNLGSGDYWNVFAICDGQLVVRNTITGSAETSYTNSGVATFSAGTPAWNEHPVCDDNYPAKEEADTGAADLPEDGVTATGPEIPEEESVAEVAPQMENRKIYLGLGQVDQNYAWSVETSDAVYGVTEETEGVYSVELPGDVETITLHGEDQEGVEIISAEVSLTELQDNNCIVVLSSEKTGEFEIVWGRYDPDTEEVTAESVHEQAANEGGTARNVIPMSPALQKKPKAAQDTGADS